MAEEQIQTQFPHKKRILSFWHALPKYFGFNSTGVRNWLTIAGLGIVGLILLGIFSSFLPATVATGLLVVSLVTTISCFFVLRYLLKWEWTDGINKLPHKGIRKVKEKKMIG